jgi:hypothetical protein
MSSLAISSTRAPLQLRVDYCSCAWSFCMHAWSPLQLRIGPLCSCVVPSAAARWSFSWWSFCSCAWSFCSAVVLLQLLVVLRTHWSFCSLLVVLKRDQLFLHGDHPSGGSSLRPTAAELL